MSSASPLILPSHPPYPDAPYLRDELLHEIFAATAGRFPERIAVRLAEGDPTGVRRTSLPYAELRQRASQFARHLRQRGVIRGDRVVICLPRSLDQYMAILATLEAGAAYVPVDWSFPQDRADYIAEESQASVVVTNSVRADAFTAAGARVVDLDRDLGDIAACDPAPLTRADTGATPEDAAYLIYTSGSTGKPKGAIIRHRNIAFETRANAAILGVTCDDRVYAGASLAFDVSVEEMWCAFFAGAELLVGSEALAKAGPDLGATLAREGVTVWAPVPSLLAVMEEDIPSVRLINAGGEACPSELVRRWAKPGRRMLNTYGPSETTGSSTWKEVTPETAVTIGRPLPGYWAAIIGDDLAPVPPGSEGELLIGGPGVGAGYLNRPELTAEKFIITSFPGPTGEPELAYRSGDLCRLTDDGEIDYLGRIDTQVKIRGYRVELGEIEAVLMEDPAVAQAVVALFPDPDGADLLVAFLVAARDQTIDTDRLRELLRIRLPGYMHPQAFEIRKQLATLVSGKVDRKALQRPDNIAVEQRPIELPATPTEMMLHEAWSQIFAPAPVSVTDDFFEELGGHSLRAARLVSLLRRDPAMKMISIQDIYAAPTIRSLATRMDEARLGGEHAAKVETPFRPHDPLSRTLCVIGQTLALIPIYAFSGLQWLTPYLVYNLLTTDDPSSRLPALGYALLTFLVMPPAMILLSIAVKWAVIGRIKPGDYPVWGAYYFRWWFVRRFLGVIPIQFLSGTPLMRIYYRALGARIGQRVQLRLSDIDAPDLVQIGDDAIVSEGANLATSGVERGVLRLGTVTLGPRSFVGSMAVVGRDSQIAADGVLSDLSMMPAAERLGEGEVWSGSPARRVGPAPQRDQPPPPGIVRRTLVSLGLVVAALLLPLAAVLPIGPGLIMIIELDWATTGYGYIALTPLLAVIYVLAMCGLTVVAKWLLIGRVKPGTYSLWSGFYVRLWFVRQLGELALDLLHPLYATLYVRPWYLALGAKVGKRAEISTATSLVPDLIEIGSESFIADGVVFGAPRAVPGGIQLARTRIGHRTFVGNSGLLPTGADLGDEVLLGVLSKPPEAAEAALEKGSTWFGSPAIRLPRRQIATVFDEGARFKPSRRLVATRLAIESVRVTLSLTVFLSLFSILLSVISDISDRPNGALWVMVTFPFLYMAFAISAGLFVIGLKWLVIGRYRPTNQPLWSLFVWRTELVTSTYENLAAQTLLAPLRGTPWLNMYLRALGCRIGKRVFTDTTDITEYDLVEVGDDAALNEGAGLQTHLFEDRVMKVSGLQIGARATVGSMAIVLYDAVIEDDAQLGDLSVLMKGETLPAGTSWEGSPARPARGA
jgi:non-ribosomal peptide synthetase-like protein